MDIFLAEAIFESTRDYFSWISYVLDVAGLTTVIRGMLILLLGFFFTRLLFGRGGSGDD